MAHGKKYRAADSKINREKKYSMDEAFTLLPQMKISEKFDETVDLAIRLPVPFVAERLPFFPVTSPGAVIGGEENACIDTLGRARHPGRRRWHLSHRPHALNQRPRLLDWKKPGPRNLPALESCSRLVAFDTAVCGIY